MAAPTYYTDITSCGQLLSGQLSGGEELWFKFNHNSVHPGDGIIINGCGSGFDTVMEVYYNSDFSNVHLSNDDNGGECNYNRASYLDVPYYSGYSGDYWLKLRGYSSSSSGYYSFIFECDGVTLYPTVEPTSSPTYEYYDPYYDDAAESTTFFVVGFIVGGILAVLCNVALKQLIGIYHTFKQEQDDISQDPQRFIKLIGTAIGYTILLFVPVIVASSTGIWLVAVNAYILTLAYYGCRKRMHRGATPPSSINNNVNPAPGVQNPRQSVPITINQAPIMQVPQQPIMVVQQPQIQPIPQQVIYMPQPIQPGQPVNVIQQAPPPYTYQTPEDQAAVKIQAAWRGQQVRKKNFNQ